MIAGRDELQKNADKINSKNLGKYKNIFFWIYTLLNYNQLLKAKKKITIYCRVHTHSRQNGGGSRSILLKVSYSIHQML